MPTFLDVPEEERERALALGACREAGTLRIYVPDDTALASFQTWLPTVAGSAVTLSSPPGTSLTALLKRIEGAVAHAFPQPEWVRIEISEIGGKGGHLYLVAIDRAEDGTEISKAKAIIWSSQANTIGRKFFKATGSQLTAGIKVLVLVQPGFKPQHGLSLVISDIDPGYTLGDMHARLKRIRETLQAEGIAEKNRSLPAPADFCRVAVIAPTSAAGLEDFQVEANRLTSAGLCEFTYFDATFQGEQTKLSIRQAFIDANEMHKTAPIDALVVIRGGGAAADLHWLNEELLARMVCRFPVPVLTGIGHERDSTILDECANQRFGTPSKVIAHISRAIAQNAQQAMADWNAILHAATARVNHAETKAGQTRDMMSAAIDKRLDRAAFESQKYQTTIRNNAVSLLDLAGRNIDLVNAAIGSGALATLGVAQNSVDHALATVKDRARTAIRATDVAVDGHHASITLAARRSIDGIADHLDERWNSVISATSSIVGAADAEMRRNFGDIRFYAIKSLAAAEEQSKQTMEAILAHGVGPTLKRGFALVRAGEVPVSSKEAALRNRALNIEFRDGTITVINGD